MIDIEALAREAGMHITSAMEMKGQYVYSGNFHSHTLAAYTNAVLEAAAQSVESLGWTGVMVDDDVCAEQCIEAIRALKVTP